MLLDLLLQGLYGFDIGFAAYTELIRGLARMICLLTLGNLAGLARRYQLKLKEALLIDCSLCRRGVESI